MRIKVAIGADHAGYQLKGRLKEVFSESIEFTDFGTNSLESVDYPDFAHPVSDSVEGGKSQFGVLICGSGNGINMTANKHKGIRAALCWDVELASLARQHNNANILTLPARFISEEKAIEILKSFMNTEFEGGRHQKRVEKI